MNLPFDPSRRDFKWFRLITPYVPKKYPGLEFEPCKSFEPGIDPVAFSSCDNCGWCAEFHDGYKKPQRYIELVTDEMDRHREEKRWEAQKIEDGQSGRRG